MSRAFLASLDPDDTTTLSHNALFDASVSSYRYGFVPKLMVCTLGIARAVLNLKAYSLKSVAEHLGLGAKGEEIHQASGMRLADLKANPDFYRKYINYALNDDTLCEGIYNKLVRTGRVSARGDTCPGSGSAMCRAAGPARQRIHAQGASCGLARRASSNCWTHVVTSVRPS